MVDSGHATREPTGTLTSHVHFTYDVYNRLIGKQVDPTGGGTYTSAQWYAYDATPTPQSSSE